MAYSNDLRLKTLEYIQQGGSRDDTYKIFGIGRQTLYDWLKRFKETGTVDVKKRTKYHKKIDLEDLKNFVELNPDAYLREIAFEFDVTPSGIWRALRKLKITLKKNKHLQRK